jgi:hypothetical protein
MEKVRPQLAKLPPNRGDSFRMLCIEERQERNRGAEIMCNAEVYLKESREGVSRWCRDA